MKPLDVLLVDDNPGDVALCTEALRQSHQVDVKRLYVCEDGVQAMAFLRREAGYEEAPRPDLILLDLNMPRMDGRQVLAEVKEEGTLRRIPVIVLTSSRAREDVERSYDLHANCYVTKPLNLDQFFDVVARISEFWGRVAQLPVQ